MKMTLRMLLCLSWLCCSAVGFGQYPGAFSPPGMMGPQPTPAPLRNPNMNPALAPNMPPAAAVSSYPTTATQPFSPATQNPWVGSFGAPGAGIAPGTFSSPQGPYPTGPLPALPPGPAYGGPNGTGYGGNFMPGCCGDDGSSCGGDCCDPGCSGGWFAGFAGLIMTRNNPNRTILTSLNSNPLLDVMNTRDAKSPWNGGVEARIGKVLGCNSAVEMSYFWIDPLQSSAQVNSPTDSLIHSSSCFCNLTAGGTVLQDLADNAAQHRFLRRDEFHNLELNYLFNTMNASLTRVGYTGLVGMRWFRFQEGTSYGVAAGGTAFGDNGGTTSAFFDQNLTNNFIGFQTGGRGYWNATSRLRLFVTPKVGLGVLTVDRYVIFKRGDGIIATNTQGETMNNHYYKNDFSMLAQFDLGTAYQITPRISIYGAYRIIGLAGVALFENNIPPESHSISDQAGIGTNGSLVLHGAVAGMQISF